MFSVTTGEQTRILKGHKSQIIGTSINPANPLQLYSFGRDRKIYLWDYNDAIILSKFKLDFIPEHFQFDPNDSSIVYVGAFGNRNNNNIASSSYDIYRVHLDSNSPKNLQTQELNDSETLKSEIFDNKEQIKEKKTLDCQLLLQSKARKRSFFLTSPNGDFLIVQSKRHWKLFDLKTNNIRKFYHRNNISCISIHPKQQFVATGDDIGEIIFWYCFDEPKENSQALDSITTTFHWHAHQLNTILFDSTGSHMYSGGQEMVLVIWQLESGKKDFLPRLGAVILGINSSPDETLLSIRCADNTIKIINSRSRLLHVNVQGIDLPGWETNMKKTRRKTDLKTNLKMQKLKTGIVLDPRHHSLVFNASEGQLQFYSPQEDTQIMKIQIGHKNSVKNFQETKINESKVIHVVFSSNGKWMVTVDERKDVIRDSALKFWFWDQPSQKYLINTHYNLKQTEKIKTLIFHPKKEVCIVVDQLGKFKLWSVKLRSNFEIPSAIISKFNNRSQNNPNFELNESNQSYLWSVDISASYRNLQAKSASFSSDGSLLAIANNHVITLWNPESTMLLSTLIYPSVNEHITKLAFIPNSQYLVACSKKRMFFWDLISCQIKWIHKIQVEILVVDQNSFRFAVLCPPEFKLDELQIRDSSKIENNSNLYDGYVIMFCAPSYIPTGYWILPPFGIRGLSFFNSNFTKSDTHSSLIYLNDQHEFKFLLDSSNSGHNILKKQNYTQQQQFLSNLNAKKLAEGPSVFKLMYGSDSILNEAPQTSSRNSISLPKISSKKKVTSLFKNVNRSPASEKASQLTATFLQELFQGESHILAPPSILFPQFSDVLIIKSQFTKSSGPLLKEIKKAPELKINQNNRKNLTKLIKAKLSSDSKILKIELSSLLISSKPNKEYSIFNEIFSGLVENSQINSKKPISPMF